MLWPFYIEDGKNKFVLNFVQCSPILRAQLFNNNYFYSNKMKKLFLLLLCTSFFACNDGAELQSKIQEMENELTETKEKLATAEASAVKQPGLIHTVFFWLKEDLSESDVAAFLEGVKSLRGVKTVKSCYIGPPAPTEERGVVDNTYSFALINHFEDVAGQDAYQIDPIHLKFVEDHKDKWTKVIVYDNLVKY